MDTVHELTRLDVSKISAYLDTCEVPFEPSQLYSPATDTKSIDTSIRLSEFRALTDPVAFDLADELVQQVAALVNDDQTEWTLVRNDVTHIRYSQGGFFQRHQDYLSLQSNMVLEYTLLVCTTPAHIAANTQGGETLIHVAGASKAYSATCNPGGALLFRKDLEHEGAVVSSGEKHLISLNLWAMRKPSAGGEQVLLISCKNDPRDGEGPSQQPPMRAQDAGVSALLEQANAQSCVLAVRDLPDGSTLAQYASRCNRTSEEQGKPPQPVLRYQANCTYEEFGTVYRICTKSHLSAHELSAHKHVVSYFFPGFRQENMLVDLALEPPAAAQAAPAPAQLPGGLAHKAASEAAADLAARIAQETDTEVICCENEQRTAVLVELARNLDLPYVPFKMVFVEGIVVLNFGGDCHKIKLPVLPAYITLGCYENIFAYRKIATRRDTLPASLMQLAEQHDIWRQESIKQCTAQASHYWAKEFWPGDDEMYDVYDSETGTAAMMGLRVALDPVLAQKQMYQLLFEEHVQIHKLPAIHLPDDYGSGPIIEWQCSVADGSFITLSDEALQSQLQAASLNKSLPVIVLRAGDAAFCADEANKVLAALYNQQKSEFEETRATLENGRAVLQLCARLFKNEDHCNLRYTLGKFDVTLGGCDTAPRGHIMNKLKDLVLTELGLSVGTHYSQQWLETELIELKRRYRDAFGSQDEFHLHHCSQNQSERRVALAAAVAVDFEERSNGDVVLPKLLRELLERGAPLEPEPMHQIEYQLFRWHKSNEASMRVTCLKHGDRVRETTRYLRGVARAPTDGRNSVAATAVSSSAEVQLKADTSISHVDPKQSHATESTPPSLSPQSAGPASRRLFHLDSYGKTCFSAAEAEAASERIIHMHLDERVKACLQRKRFLLPQQNHGFNAHFCNESVYGTVNLLCVSGVVRMEQPEDVSLQSNPSPPWLSEIVRTFLCGTHDESSPLHLFRKQCYLLEKIVKYWWCSPGAFVDALVTEITAANPNVTEERLRGGLTLNPDGSIKSWDLAHCHLTVLPELLLGVTQANTSVFDAWPPPEVIADKRHRDFESKPREWMDDGSESDPENAPGYISE